jgi:hypothetical protein
MDKSIIQAILDGDSSGVRVINLENLNTVYSLVGIYVFVWAVSSLVGWVSGGLAFLIIIGVPIYGLYLTLKNEAVMYLDKSDLISIALIPAVPIGMAILLAIIDLFPDSVNDFLITASLLASAGYFGLRTANANEIVNSPLTFFERFSVLYAKLFFVWLFILAIFGSISSIAQGRKMAGEAVTVGQASAARNQTVRGGILLAIVSGLGYWFYTKSINAEHVFLKRGVVDWEQMDSNSHGVGDSSDAFQEDPMQVTDVDDDSGNADAFLIDASDTLDTDGDAAGDDNDAFQPDLTEDTDVDFDDANTDSADNDPRRD